MKKVYSLIRQLLQKTTSQYTTTSTATIWTHVKVPKYARYLLLCAEWTTSNKVFLFCKLHTASSHSFPSATACWLQLWVDEAKSQCWPLLRSCAIMSRLSVSEIFTITQHSYIHQQRVVLAWCTACQLKPQYISWSCWQMGQMTLSTGLVPENNEANFHQTISQ